MYVCQTITFKSLDVASSYKFALKVKMRLKFIHEGHHVKIEVTGAKKLKNHYSRNVCLVLINNSSSIEHRTMKFARSMRFLATVDQTVCPSPCHVTGSEYA